MKIVSAIFSVADKGIQRFIFRILPRAYIDCKIVAKKRVKQAFYGGCPRLKRNVLTDLQTFWNADKQKNVEMWSEMQLAIFSHCKILEGRYFDCLSIVSKFKFFDRSEKRAEKRIAFNLVTQLLEKKR